jgi:drug/metabolite transporter (DMT)-like permease
MIAGTIYSVENVALYWTLLNASVSFYIIGRTFSAFVNILFSKYYIKKNIPKLYYVGLLFLAFSYVLFIVAYSDGHTNKKETISIVIIFLSSITTSIYNNMAEKYFDKIDDVTDKDKMTYQLLFNFCTFISGVPFAFGYALYNKQFSSVIGLNLIYSATGIFSQITILFKMYVLSSTLISGNQVLTGIDLLRRLTTNILAYTWFGDALGIEIIFANVCMVIGGLLILIGSKQKNVIAEEDKIEMIVIEK